MTRYEKIRCLPISIMPEDQIWCIVGAHRDSNGQWGGGILEWCYDEFDAKAEFFRLSSDTTGQFDGLSFHKYSEML